MPGESPFANDWRDCLRAHFTYTVRAGDQITERTLIEVLRELGFGESELSEMRVMATMRVEDVGEDFVPDLDILAEDRAPAQGDVFMVTLPPIQSQSDQELFESSAELYLPDEALNALNADIDLQTDDQPTEDDGSDADPTPAAQTPTQLTLF